MTNTPINDEATVRTWDIDRYEQLQDSAWELDAWASEQDGNAKRQGRRSEGSANRARAAANRTEAARMLTDYWTLPTTNAPMKLTATPRPTTRRGPDARSAAPTTGADEQATWEETAEARADDDGWPIRVHAPK